jgi:hypothetical protein
MISGRQPALVVADEGEGAHRSAGRLRQCLQEDTMTKTLRDQLIGAWKLVSHVEKPVVGSEPVYPMGEKLEGIMIYAPDSYVSVHIMRPGIRRLV